MAYQRWAFWYFEGNILKGGWWGGVLGVHISNPITPKIFDQTFWYLQIMLEYVQNCRKIFHFRNLDLKNWIRQKNRKSKIRFFKISKFWNKNHRIWWEFFCWTQKCTLFSCEMIIFWDISDFSSENTISFRAICRLVCEDTKKFQTDSES